MRAEAPRAHAYVGLGSNLKDPRRQLRHACSALAQLPATRLQRCSSLYRTAPVGAIVQPEFMNAVCVLETALTPVDLLQRLLAIEAAQGRMRTQAPPGGPRTLDLDLLLYADQVLQAPDLTLPHPRMHERAFVLYPLVEIAPAVVIPGRGPAAGLLPAVAAQAVTRLTEGACDLDDHTHDTR